MRQYKDLLKEIKLKGTWKPKARENMPRTLGISNAHMSFDLRAGFPLLTTKRVFYKGIIHELLWFLRGDTNIKYLVDNGVNIWNPDAYKWYLKMCSDIPERDRFSLEQFVESIREIEDGTNIAPKSNGYRLGDLGKVYGYQWRNQNGVDQVAEVIQSLQTNPFSRYHIIDGWNKADFKDMALPPCHLLYQFVARKNIGARKELILDLNMYQRSCDTFLGVPFNIASASLLLMIMANVSGMEAGTFNWIGGDTHIYEDHLEKVDIQLPRGVRKLPQMTIKRNLNNISDIESLTIDDFEVTGYDPHPPIKANLSAGLKKK